jgi:iron complex outermembrane recepter protein
MGYRNMHFGVLSITVRRLLILTAASTAQSLVIAQTVELPAQSLDEVVVTAQKRQENVNDVAAAIRAFTGKELQDVGINDPLDLGKAVPGLITTSSNLGGAQEFFLRGVGLTDFSSTTNPSVGIYVDEVYKPAPEMANFGMFDMERVEVLKGPQGTLYGRNSTAGAVNFLAQEPTKDSGGYARIGYSSFNDKHYEGALNIPAAQTLFLRVSIDGDQAPADGYFTNLLNDYHYGQRDENAVRAQALWKPTDAFQARLILYYGYKNDDVYSFTHVSTQSAADHANMCGPVLAGNIAEGPCVDNLGYASPSSNPFVGEYDYPNHERSIDRDATLRLTYDFSRISATSISAFQKFDRNQQMDVDASPFVQNDNVNSDGIIAWSQEFRLSSDNSWSIPWIVGAFYSYDHIDFAQAAALTQLYGFSVSDFADQHTTSEALYGTATLPISSHFDFVGGLRATREVTNWRGSTFSGSYGSIEAAEAAGANVFSALPLPPGNPGVGGPEDFPTRIETNKINYKATFEYRPITDWLLYAGVSDAFRSGGFSTAVSLSQSALQPYGPETITDYEVGSKATLFNGRMQFNSGAFYYDYKGYQANFISKGGLSTRLQNVGNVHISGLETDITARPIDSWLLRIGGDLTHTEVVDSDVELIPYGSTQPTTLTGKTLANAPKWSFNGLTRYDLPLPGHLKSSYQLDFSYESSHFTEPNNRLVLEQAGFVLLNARIAISDSSGRWELAGWVKNLTDQIYKTNAYDVASGFGFDSVTYGPPRTAGADFTYNF